MWVGLLVIKCFASAKDFVGFFVDAVFRIDLVADFGVDKEQDDEGDDGALSAHVIVEWEASENGELQRFSEQDDAKRYAKPDCQVN